MKPSQLIAPFLKETIVSPIEEPVCVIEESKIEEDG